MATPVSLDFNGQSGGSSVGGGGFNIDVAEIGGDPIGSFISWCIELTQSISSNGFYSDYVQSFDNGDTGQAGSPVAPEIDDAEELLLSSLFAQNSVVANGGGNNAENTAFQLAVWDIAYNSGTGSLNFTSSGAGNYSGNAQAGAAQTLLSSLDSTGGNYSFTYYLNDDHQDQLVGAAVPLPAGVVLLLGGLGALGAMRRRQKAA